MCAFGLIKGDEADGVNVEEHYESSPRKDKARQTNNGLLCRLRGNKSRAKCLRFGHSKNNNKKAELSLIHRIHFYGVYQLFESSPTRIQHDLKELTSFT